MYAAEHQTAAFSLAPWPCSNFLESIAWQRLHLSARKIDTGRIIRFDREREKDRQREKEARNREIIHPHYAREFGISNFVSSD